MKIVNIRPLCTFFLCAALADPMQAAIVTETETDGTSVNNSLVTAQAIAGASFTTPIPAGVFNPPGYATATLEGSNSGDDVDFFRFFANPGWVYLDMDNVNPTFDPLVALFDGSGTLIAYGDDSDLDSGSVNTVDSFVGPVFLPVAGTYYIGVSQFANLPTAALTGTETPIARPDGKDGGLAVTGVAPGVATYDFNGTQPGNAFYTLHVSLGTGAPNAVPEPTTYALSGAALLLIGAIGRRNKSNNQ